MNILIVSPVFAPRIDAEAFCGGKFAQALLPTNVDVSVICCHTGMQPPLLADGSRRWEPLRRVTVDVPNPARASLIARAWRGVRYQTTTWTGWTKAVIAKARELNNKKKFTLVVSRSYPWYAHIAGYWVSSDLGIPWIVNFNDPWDLSRFIVDPKARSEWKHGASEGFWRLRVLAKASAVTFPCERLRDYTLQGFRRKRVEVIPHVGASVDVTSNERDFVIVHAGKLRMHEATGRRANAMIEGLAQFFAVNPAARPRTRLVFVGPEDPVTAQYAAALGVESSVTSIGQVGYDESLAFIASATACLLVEADLDTGIFLPSKLCDYIAARKPIIALSPATGTVNDLSKEGGIIRVGPHDSGGVADALQILFDAFVRGGLGRYAPPESLACRYESTTIAKQFLRVAAEVTRDGRDRVNRTGFLGTRSWL